MFMSSYAPGAQYKNLEENQILEEREFFGKEFLINDEFNDLEWTLEKESKQIGQYVAFKATAVKEIDENDQLLAVNDGIPVNWTRPTTSWDRGEIEVKRLTNTTSFKALAHSSLP